MTDFDTLADGLLQSLTDAEMKRCIGELNDRFTAGRHRLAGYGDDPALVSAYAAFYLPTNMQKLPFVLSQLSGFPLTLDTPLEIIDFGCGPGTYGFALYEWLRAQHVSPLNHTTFHFIDAAPLMLRQAQKFRQMRYPEMTAAFGASVPQRQAGVQRLALFGNVVNEMGGSAFNRLLARLDPDAMIFIEPGTQESFRLMSEVRTLLLGGGYQVWYPCAKGEACPVAGRDGEWCHQVLKASLSPSVARLGQLAGLDRTIMPFIGHVYSKQNKSGLEGIPDAPLSVSGTLFRLKTHSKHAFFWEVCLQTETGLSLVKVELPKKNLTKAAQKNLARISAGQRISFNVQKMLGDGTWRIENVRFDTTG
ncbi:MAG: hypothetical protein JXX14_17315 [Deltaproteobacteria bacterium]|nr:hypothetical protein [Deltaproteobacteria bacterium]